MIHPTDDELLDLALDGGDRDTEVLAHLRDCAACSSRFEKVKGEQELLKRAFAAVDPPALLESKIIPRREALRWAAAAAILLALGMGSGLFAAKAIGWRRDADRLAAESAALKSRLLELESRRLPATGAPAFEQIQKDLKTVAHKIIDRRKDLAKGDPGSPEDYFRLVEEGEGLFVDGVEEYLARIEPLQARQKTELRRTLDRFSERALQERDPSKLGAEYRAALREILSPDQVRAFEEYAHRAAEEERDDDIETLANDIGRALDLRVSEIERVRRLLEEKYPNSALPGIDLEVCPVDSLLSDETLATQVRRSLDAVYHVRFDRWLRDQSRARDEAEHLRKGRRPDK